MMTQRAKYRQAASTKAHTVQNIKLASMHSIYFDIGCIAELVTFILFCLHMKIKLIQTIIRMYKDLNELCPLSRSVLREGAGL